ncbi:MAG: AAA family ATPase [Candidatus Lokiarchaeota archaeon]|nr:AAA family ATPase [Candidatus Lokiarchaeota archaeon]
MLVIVVGDLGSGKTLFLTYLAKHSKYKIYSNFNLRLNNYHKLTIKKLLELEESQKSLVFIDEAYTWLESRSSGRSINKLLSYIYFQSRKRNLDFFLTAQLAHTIDRRFREMFDYCIKCETKGPYFHYAIFNRKRLITRLKLRYDKAKKYFPLYDTFQIIMEEDAINLAWQALDREDKIKEIKKLKEEFLEWTKKEDKERITHDLVKYFLWKNKYPKSIEKFLYLEVVN